MSRWVHPVVPENNIGGRVISGHYSHNRHNVYLHSDVSLARSVCIYSHHYVYLHLNVSLATSIYIYSRHNVRHKETEKLL